MREKLFWKTCAPLVLITLALTSSQAKADTLPINRSISMTATDWSNVFSIPKFDPALGTLQSITFSFMGTAEGDTTVTNPTTTSGEVTVGVSSKLKLARPDGSLLVQVIPLGTVTEDIPAGPCVITHSGLSGTASDAFTTSSPADLALFTGTDSINLPVSAKGQGYAMGPANMSYEWNASASAGVTVTYNYVPEPVSIVMMLLGGISAAVSHARRRS